MKKEINELVNLLKKNKFHEILEKKDFLLKLYPNSEVIFDILGLADLNLRNYDDAIISFKRALEINPNFFQSYNNLGSLLDDLKDYEEAIFYYKKGLKLRPNNHLILNNIAQCLSSLGSFKEARDYYEEAIVLEPKFFQAYNNLGILLQNLGFYKEAIISYEKCLEIEPNYFKAHNNLGIIFLLNAEISKSKISFKNAQKINPEYAPLYWNMHGFSSNINDAILLLKKCIDFDSNNKEAYQTLSFLEAYLGNTDLYKSLLISDSKNDPYMRSFKWIFSLPKLPSLIFSRWSFFDKMISLSIKSRPFYEFGVWTGVSFRYLMKSYESGYGFDTFTGITEDWYNEKKGSYSSQGEIPSISGGRFIVGAFNETLPIFFLKKRPKASIINFDADLYSSTLCALENSYNIIDNKTILIFDEFIISDSWEEDEFKALNEFSVKYNLRYEVLAVSIFTKQVAVRFLNI